MQIRFVVPVLTAVVLMISGCASFKVHSDYDPEVDFTQYVTYSWLPRTPDPDSPVKSDSLLYNRIERAANNNLTAKGMKLVLPGEEANLLVTEHIGIEQKLQVNTTNYGYGSGYGYGRGAYYGSGYQQTNVDQYEEGTLMLDLIDAKTKQLVWRGTAQSRLKELNTPEERNKRIRDAVNAILERYPPAKKN